MAKKGRVKGKRDYKRDGELKKTQRERKKGEEEIVVTGRRAYLENVYKTMVPTAFGVIGGAISIVSIFKNFAFNAVLLVIFLILVERYIALPRLVVSKFMVKDWFYISVMTFLAWYISFTIFLNV
ncbi:MAG: hypothetical protein EF806_06275 [Candidatus Methanoliparum thermophilum]|uniref:Uncharacterized protein n=1 Tax=Methanoliparum thermophilum TaxID=2491083 RepID=A0A520KQM1_METT2|nr:hypothetical protein [Candidatus Methanoliparum sp. LAM-1]RZN63837.1 MAG: hypothetical protein EF806_06275 [Candidatus Methanoliparum thermophilum]BDC36439.1 hypothetical protein MTLP_11210 [Candidatus Methanoliparum sp. LAM-1]